MTEIHTIALFGEAEKGRFRTPHFCESLPQLVDCLGNPPPDSKGLFCAVQALLYERNLIFFRVEEEGFSYQDYLYGLRLLEEETKVKQVAALCLPGVGDPEILNATISLCKKRHTILIITQPDLYDFLTNYLSG